MHQFHSLFVFGFLPSLPYCLLFPPLPFPPFQENGGVAPLPAALPRLSATRVAQPVPLDATPAPRCNIEHWNSRDSSLVAWMIFPQTSWKASRKETSEQAESTRDHDYTSITCIPAWVQPRPPKWCFASLSWFSSDDVLEVSVARDSWVKVVEFPFKASHSRLCRWDTSHLSMLAAYYVEGQPQPLGPLS